MISVDLNSDLGEGFGLWEMGDDAAMLAIVTSANVACGYHASDPSVMRRMCSQAAANGVAIGAHVSYPDLIGFGRRFMEMSSTELADAVLYQIGALDAMARAAGATVAYVKPHGALYNTIAHHEQQAAAVVAGVKAFRSDLPIMGFAGSVVLRLAAKQGLRPVTEAFADRAYNPDGSLVSRTLPGSVLHDPAVVAARAVRMMTKGRVTAIDGSEIAVSAESLCVHGDTPGAVRIAQHIRSVFVEVGVHLRSFG